MDQERISFVALHFVPGVGDILIKQLVSYCGSAEQVFKQSRGRLLKIPGIGEITAEAIHHGKAFDKAEQEFRIAEREDTEILLFTDKAYSEQLTVAEELITSEKLLTTLEALQRAATITAKPEVASLAIARLGGQLASGASSVLGATRAQASRSLLRFEQRRRANVALKSALEGLFLELSHD